MMTMAFLSTVKIDNWFAEDVAQRFTAYDWHVITDVNGHNYDDIQAAINNAKQQDKPVLIMCKTEIGFGSPNLVGTAKSHGAPLGIEERELTAKKLDWHAAPFDIADDLYQAWSATARGQEKEDEWNKLFADYSKEHPELAAEFKRRINGDLPSNWQELCESFINEIQEIGDKATRQSSNAWLNLAQKHLPELLGGSADLSGSNGTLFKDAITQTAAQPNGNYISYGVREFGMAAIMNGVAAYGGFIPYGGTFLVFADYAKKCYSHVSANGPKSYICFNT